MRQRKLGNESFHGAVDQTVRIPEEQFDAATARRFVRPARHWLARGLILAILALPIIAATQTAAQAGERKAWAYATLPGVPEGIGVNSKGELYASLALRCEVVRVEDDGGYTHIAWVPSQDCPKGSELLGFDFDQDDNLFIAYKNPSKWDNWTSNFHPGCRDATETKSGVYKIEAGTNAVTPFVTRADGVPMCWPDDIDIDDAGNLYLSDLTYAGIWKISPAGEATMWSDHPLLNWSAEPYSGWAVGVNVLVLDNEQKNIYAATDGDPVVLRIPIESDGSAGEPVVISSGHTAFDGIEIDEEGYIYVSEILRDEIWVLSPDGKQRTIIANKENAPLDSITSLVLRDGVLYGSNSGFFNATGNPDNTVIAVQGFPKPKAQ